MAYLASDFVYYENSGNLPQDKNWGSYQYVKLKDIVNNFMLMYTGNHSLVNNEERFKVLFHAKQSIMQIAYHANNDTKKLELNVPNNLKFVFPPDYVGFVAVYAYKNGLPYKLTEDIYPNSSRAYLQDNDAKILFDQDGNALEPEYSTIDYDRITGSKKSIYLNKNSIFYGEYGYCCDGGWYFDYEVGSRFGLNTETANANPTYKLDKEAGCVNFSNGMVGELAILEYVSDGMYNGDDDKVKVHKFFEQYVYNYIRYMILSNKIGTPQYTIRDARKEMFNDLKNARLAIGNIKADQLKQTLRGQDKWIK